MTMSKWEFLQLGLALFLSNYIPAWMAFMAMFFIGLVTYVIKSVVSHLWDTRNDPIQHGPKIKPLSRRGSF